MDEMVVEETRLAVDMWRGRDRRPKQSSKFETENMESWVLIENIL
jgi:hypothetical protein